MKPSWILPIAFLFLFACTSDQASHSETMKITSTVFEHTESIPSKYTCDGDNVNPPLEFKDVPEGTVSLALIMEDPDVPKSIREDGMWDHWVTFNISPAVVGVREDSRIEGGVRGKNTKGKKKYGGPCPPDREHRYFFKLFALDTMLDLKKGATKTEVEEAMEGHVIEVAQLIGRYERNN